MCSSKSSVASEAAVKLNPRLHINPLQNRVSPETEGVFNDAFWEGLDLVVNALDNVNARLYVDSRCAALAPGDWWLSSGCTVSTLSSTLYANGRWGVWEHGKVHMGLCNRRQRQWHNACSEDRLDERPQAPNVEAWLRYAPPLSTCP